MNVCYRKIRQWKYQTTTPCSTFVAIYRSAKVGPLHLTTDGWLQIDTGYCWDGPSGPTFDTKTFMRGSLVHDALYQLLRAGKLPQSHRLNADMILRSLCLQDGMSRVRAWWVYRALRAGGAAAAEVQPEINPRQWCV